MNTPDLPLTDPLPNKATRLLTPHQMREAIPLTLLAKRTRDKAAKEIEAILSGKDDRQLLICGPCSIHDTHAAMEYALRLRKLAQSVSDSVLIVMRVYFEKPRTTVGWKGLIYDPGLNEGKQPQDGIRIARQLLASINSIGLPCATEFLNPMVAQYLEDAVAYGCIGARTSESQIHRELASRLSIPMGIKNGIDGSAKTASNAILAANSPQTIFQNDDHGMPQVLETKGNPHAHMILRGGSQGPNYDVSSISEALSLIPSKQLQRPIIVDCSHGNSRKKHVNQSKVLTEVIEQVANGQDRIAGVMLESNLVAGNQAFRPGLPHCYGQSITDECIGWEETESLVNETAANLRNAKTQSLQRKTCYA